MSTNKLTQNVYMKWKVVKIAGLPKIRAFWEKSGEKRILEVGDEKRLPTGEHAELRDNVVGIYSSNNKLQASIVGSPVHCLQIFNYKGNIVLITGCQDYSVKCWQLVQFNPTTSTTAITTQHWVLKWSSHPTPSPAGCEFEGLVGLSEENELLLKQQNIKLKGIDKIENSSRENWLTWSPARIAAAYDDVDTILSHITSLKELDLDGNTLLHTAVAFNATKVATLLCACIGDLPNNMHVKACQVAKLYHNPNLAEFLQIMDQGEEGTSVINMAAIKSSYTEICASCNVQQADLTHLKTLHFPLHQQFKNRYLFIAIDETSL